MTFHNFTGGNWKIFSGNILMLITCMCYIAWWVAAFRPGRTARSSAPALITLTLATGICSLILLGLGIGKLSESGRIFPMIYIPAGAVLLYIILLIITKQMFNRVVTSELLIMILWAAFEIAAGNVLAGNGSLGTPATIALMILIAAATCAGLVCYILYYRLDGVAGFLDGLIPIAVDGLVVAIFLAVQMIS
jgi:hypothetical protein